MNEPITLHVSQRPGCGTNLFRCNGKTASCTGNEEYGVERCAAKALAVIAALQKNPALLKRKPRITAIGGSDAQRLKLWEVVYAP